jgi:hypothetical protein
MWLVGDQAVDPVLVYAGSVREMYRAVVRLIAGFISRLLQYL